MEATSHLNIQVLIVVNQEGESKLIFFEEPLTQSFNYVIYFFDPISVYYV